MPQATSIPKGSLGFDYYELTPPILQLLIDRKAGFVCRYIGTGTSAKLVTNIPLPWDPQHRTEIQILRDHGIGFLAQIEHSSNDVLGGAPAGLKIATEAVTAAKALGYPAGLPILLAADIQVIDGTYPGAAPIGVAAAYMTAGCQVLRAAGYLAGGYVNELLAKTVSFDVVCIPGAPAWSAALWQEYKAKLPFGLTVHMIQRVEPANNVDRLETFTAFPVWLPSPDPIIVPPPVQPPAVPPGTVLRPSVRYGNTGPTVKVVQHAVGAVEDGMFGPKTLTAVKAWQMRNHLVVDGVIGPQSWGAILAGRR